MEKDRPLIRVAVPVPLADSFDYLLPAGSPLPPLGSRVRVPFGRRERVGVVIEHPASTALAAARLKPIREALDAQPLIGAELMQTLRWAAGYYHHPIGEVLSHALPAPLRAGRALDDRGKRRARAAPEAPRVEPREPPELTPDQARVIATIEADGAAARGFRAYLLHGVTGSGKTEVYLRLIAAALAAGRQTLLLVPEIGLTPQLVARLRERFGEELAILHSGLAERERFDAWRKAHRLEARLIVGTRSAVFAPLPAAGLVIVDEEHDSSYKQQRGFRYSARDLAVVRARRLAIPVLLASATPSLESFHNAELGRYQKLEMPRRIGRAGEPRLKVIDLGQHASRHGLSTPLVSAIGKHLASRNQVLLFLNRRGFAPALFCPGCKTTEQCTRCDARMTVHAKDAVLKCHHCGQQRPLVSACPRCGGERIPVGAGTQRVGEELATLFPTARLARLDRDATSRKGTLDAVLRDVESGNVEILVGTQMLTKGHDFPRVTLVGVLNADQGLFGTDPRSHERLAQTILQVAGRAGRAELPGEVLIQTHYPDHPLLQCLLSQDYAAFAALALAERRETGWPPFSHLAVWRAEAARREPALEFLGSVRAAAAEARAAGRREVSILGPAPQPMERKEGRYRAQLLFQSAHRGPLHELLDQTLATVRGSPKARRVRWSIDVDPLEL
jgi:primosomal protein N' (replication factor Y)